MTGLLSRWYITGPIALAASLLASTLHPVGIIAGPLAVMIPIWIYRGNVHETMSRDPNDGVRHLAYEMRYSVEAFFGVASGLLFLGFVLLETVFSGSGDLFAVIAGQLAGFPIPVAYWVTTLLAFAGLDSGAVTAGQFAGFALIAFGLAYAVKEVSR